MYCRKCGAFLDNNTVYCNKCGTYQNNQNVFMGNPKKNSNGKNLLIGFGIGLGVVLIVLLVICVFGKNEYYFNDAGYLEEPEVNPLPSNDNSGTNPYVSAIITDNVYSGVSIYSANDAYNLISEDSVNQKNKCPKEILQIENDLIEKYSITAVNLCELDINLAKEIVNVFEIIYNEYPMARGTLTNLTIWNAGLKENGTIAAFMPFFLFANSDNQTFVYKTQILLNSSYFLNTTRLQKSANSGSAAGHFPPNATASSPVAHELGHYLSFLAMMNNYNVDSILLADNINMSSIYELFNDFVDGTYTLQMLQEAYNNYKSETSSPLEFDLWRATISQYAVAKDNNGDYIYDETIAEAFHDVYLNKENAADASKYVISVLKSKLGGGK